MQNHAALDFDLALIKDRVQNDIPNHVEREVHIVLQHARIIGRDLATGIGVDIAAHVLNGLGNLQCGAPLRALERHVFKEMGHPILFEPLVAAPCRNPDTKGCGLQPRHILSDDTKPVWQGVLFNGQLAMCFLM